MTARCRWVAATCLLLAPLSGAAEPRTDNYGDPLPDGAVARMGTVRFRHTGSVLFACFSPDGKTIVSAGNDDVLRWWDAASGKELRRWVAPAAVRVAAASPDRRVLAVQVGDDVLLLDAASGKEQRRLRRPDQRLGGVAFSPDRKLLATCGERIWLWDAVSGERIRDMDAYGRGRYTGVTFLPDGRTLVSLGDDGALRWWDAETGQPDSDVQAHRQCGFSAAAAPDGKRLASAGGDSVLKLWDPDKKAELSSAEAAAPGQQAVCLVFSPDGKVLAAGCKDGAVRLYGAADGALLRRCEGGHQDAVAALAFSADGVLLVSGGADGTVRQWDVAAGKEVRPFAGPTGQVRALAVAPDGKTVASAGIDRRDHLWDAADGRELRAIDLGDGETIDLLAFGPHGLTLTGVGRGGGRMVHVWTAAGGKTLSAFSLSDKQYHEAFALSPDGSAVAAFGDDSGYAVFDALKGEIRWQADGERRRWQTGAFLDDKTLALFRRPDGFATRCGSLALWTGAGAGDQVPLQLDPGSVFWATASPDGKILAEAGSGGMVRLWGVSTGEVVGWLDCGSDFVLAAAFSADGRTLATSDMEQSVSLWEVATGLRRGVVRGGQGFIDAVAFSPDGRRLYTGGHDGTVLAWDLTDLAHEGPPRAGLDDKALARLWDELASGDAGPAYRAVWTLAASPEKSTPFIRDQLVRPAPTAARVARWIAELASDDFETRERASASLRWFDEAVEPALTAAQAGRPSPEASRRLEELLAWVHRARAGVYPPDPRLVRAIEVLEDADTPASREVLADLAGRAGNEPDAGGEGGGWSG